MGTYRENMKLLPLLIATNWSFVIDGQNLDFDRLFNQLEEPRKDLTERSCMAKFRIPGGGCSLQWSKTEWAPAECVTSKNGEDMCLYQRTRACELWQNGQKRKTVNKMYCQATLEMYQSQSVTNYPGCRNDFLHLLQYFTVAVLYSPNNRTKTGK